jgi:hypothetical protein
MEIRKAQLPIGNGVIAAYSNRRAYYVRMSTEHQQY